MGVFASDFPELQLPADGSAGLDVGEDLLSSSLEREQKLRLFTPGYSLKTPIAEMHPGLVCFPFLGAPVKSEIAGDTS